MSNTNYRNIDVLITKEGHVKITDFGTAFKYIDDHSSTEYVGTAQYLSPCILYPEKIVSVKKYSPACDVWALGIIVYEMLYGSSPFLADTEYLIYKKIEHYVDGVLKIRYPPSIQGDVCDLIAALLKVNPDERLITSTSASVDRPSHTALSIKNHIFFKGIEWNNLLNTTPPYIPDPRDLPDTKNMKDGESDDWIFEGPATKISDDWKLSEVDFITKSANTNKKWFTFLNQGESVIFSGLTWKRRRLFSKQRQLILTSTPRLIYADPVKMELKGHVPWTHDKLLKCTPAVRSN